MMIVQNMINNFYVTSLIFMAGFSLFSAVNHFTAEQPGQQRRVHLLFAGITLSLVLGILTNVISSNTSTLADHIVWLRINIAFNIVIYALLPWFFAFYSGVRPKLLLVGIAALCMFLFVINLTQPNTLLYSEIYGIDRLLLPWGEEVFLPKATPSIWGNIASAYVLFVPIFAFYVLVKRFHRDHRRSTLSMMIAVTVLMVTIIQAVLVRVVGIHNLLPMAMLGFLGMVIIMGITLTRELREDRKKAEKALQYSERKARAILDQSIQFIGLLSPDGTLLDANRAALELVGVTPQDVYNKPFWESPWWNHSVELQDKLLESIKSAAAGEEVRFETNHPTTDGSLRYIDFSLRPVINEQGDVIYLIPEGHDITERKKAEENLIESQRKLTTLMGNLPGLAFRCMNDQDWTMIFMSEGCFSLTGYYSPELEGNHINSFGNLIHQDDAEMVWQKIQYAINNYTFWQIEYRIHTKEGKEKWVWEQGCGVYSNTGELEVLEGFISDITERKKAEKALQESEEKYRFIVDKAPIGIFQRSVQGNFNFCNLTLAKQFECNSIDEFLLNYNDITKRWADPEQFIEFNELLLKHGEVLGFENKLKLINGKTKWFSLFYKLDSAKSILDGFSLDITERKRAERALNMLATSFASLSGKAFFEAISKHIATEMGIDYVYVGELTETKDAVRVLGGFALGEAMGEMLYNLSDTPCSDVIKNDTCLYPTGIQQEYPKDFLLQQMGIDSYLGSRIYSKEQEPIGLLVALHSKPLNNPEILGNLFSIFLDRITAELHRMQAYDALHKNEAIQRKMVSNIGDVIVIIDKNGINKYKSVNIEKWFGWKPEELIGKSTWDNVHPDDLLIGQEFLGSIMSEPNASGTVELRYRKKDDSYCWIEITIVNLLHDPDICGLLGNYHDITERKMAEQALQLSEEKFAKAFNISPDAITLTDIETGEIIDANAGFERVYGYSVNEVIGKTSIELGIWADSSLRTELIKVLKRDGMVLDFEATAQGKSGELIYGLISGSIITVGERKMIVLTARDITERKLVEEKLKESQERYRYIVENAPIGVFQRDLKGQFKYCNITLAKHFECNTINEFLQHYDEASKRFANLDKFEEYIELLKKNGKVLGYEVETKLINGKTKWFSLYSFVDTSNHELNGFSIDITERKQTEEVLRQSEARLSALLSSMKDIIFEIDLNGCFEGSFAQDNKYLYAQPDFFIGKKFNEILPEDVSVLLSQAIESIYSGKTYQQFEYHLAIDNIIQWEHAVVTPRHNNLNEFVGVTVVCRNITERKKAEQTIKESNEYNRQLFSTSQIGLALAKMTGELVDINQAYADIIGYTIEETLQLTYWDITPEKYAEKEQEQLKSLYENGLYGPYEKEYIHKNGALVPVVLSGNIIERYGEKYIWSSVEDITERKKNNANLIKLYTAINSSKASIVITNTDGNIEFANPYFTELTGYSEDEYLGKNPKVLKSGIHTDEYYKLIWDTIKSGNTWEGEFCNRKKNGELYWEKSIITPIKNEKEEILNFVAVKSDITNEKKHECLIDITIELYEKAEHLTVEEILKYSIELGIQLTNSEIGFFHFVNEDQETISLQAWSAKTMNICNVPTLDKHYPIGKAGVWVDCFYQKEPVLHNDYSNLSHKKGLPEGHATIIRDLSVPVIIENKVVAIFGVGNKKLDYNKIDAEFLLIFAENVWNIVRRKNAETETIKAKEKAEESDRLKTAFLANMNHEIRTPLNGILGFSDLLIDESLSKTDLHEFTSMIKTSSNRLMEIVNNVLDISKIQTGQFSTEFSSISLHWILKDLLLFFTPLAEDKKIILEYCNQFDENLKDINTDEVKLNQILTNLINNAIKFTKFGNVAFGYSIKDSDIEFYVKDTGIGIPQHLHSTIFDRFTQVEDSFTREYEGAGLGLAISKGLVEMLGGKIWVESEVGIGSTFYFTLPYNTGRQGMK